ncbi:hypothetical protein STTU_6133 [Streptomyces sp. Tu6071]|nr:hypothetical protein STTU_6133 [Streptomyces sp. Tu6071]
MCRSRAAACRVCGDGCHGGTVTAHTVSSLLRAQNTRAWVGDGTGPRRVCGGAPERPAAREGSPERTVGIRGSGLPRSVAGRARGRPSGTGLRGRTGRRSVRGFAGLDGDSRWCVSWCGIPVRDTGAGSRAGGSRGAARGGGTGRGGVRAGARTGSAGSGAMRNGFAGAYSDGPAARGRAERRAGAGLKRQCARAGVPVVLHGTTPSQTCEGGPGNGPLDAPGRP